jgi:hypothetical protein
VKAAPIPTTIPNAAMDKELTLSPRRFVNGMPWAALPGDYRPLVHLGRGSTPPGDWRIFSRVAARPDPKTRTNQMTVTGRTAFASITLAALLALPSASNGTQAQPVPAPSAAAPKTSDPAKDPPGPKMVVEQDVFDAGQVVRGTQTSATFVLKNEGTEPLKILSAKPG